MINVFMLFYDYIFHLQVHGHLLLQYEQSYF